MGAFEPAGPGVDFVALEREIIEWWRDRDTVARYLRRNDGSERRFSFIDGPITANNPMGVHHAWGRMYKDLFQRYQTMLGCRQRYQNGFDGQGLWIEVEVEKELGFTSKRDIEAFGVGRFVELCKERVRRFSAIQTEQSKRLGYWMDWDNSYHTMSDENNYTIWMFLKRCAERGWLYEGRDVMPWCPRCGTGLSEHEIVTEGYREIVHPGLFVRLPVLGREGPEPESLLIWTTTPWTLPANVAAAVGPEIAYARVRVPAPEGGSEVLIVARERLAESIPGPREVLGEVPGSDLAGLTYRGPFDDLPAQAGVEHRVVAWDEVSAEEGTGIVHIAPGAGREDFRLGRDLGLAEIAPLDEFGDFVDGFGALSGMNVYDVPETVYEGLRAAGALYRLEDYSHRYPVCWRCQSELVFRLVDEWFISMDELRHRIADVTRRITWVPEFGLRRELDWLAAMDDWMVSKKRYWGLALPIYRCGCGEFEVIGSEHELRERAVEGWDEFEGHSPHRPWIDAVKIACKSCGQAVPRISDVGNPWLDAGIVPFSTLGYRTDRDRWSEWFPADWISESFPGQFRNWFYSLLTMSTVLEDAEPFRTVFSYALMRDESGEEMHKSRGNAIWFEDAADRMGVDTMRWLYARQNPAANLNFGYGAADEARRRVLIPLWNVYSFFLTYAIIDGYDPAGPAAPPPERRSELDRWVLSELAELIEGVRSALDGYRPDDAARRIEAFVDRLSNWYVRRSRRRFWRAGALGEGGGRRRQARCVRHAPRLPGDAVPADRTVHAVRARGDAQEPDRPGAWSAGERAPRRLPGPAPRADRRPARRRHAPCDDALEPRARRALAGRDKGAPAGRGRARRAALSGRARGARRRRGAGARRAERQAHRGHRGPFGGLRAVGPPEPAGPGAKVRGGGQGDPRSARSARPVRGARGCVGRAHRQRRRLRAGAGRGAHLRGRPRRLLGRRRRGVHRRDRDRAHPRAHLRGHGARDRPRHPGP